jgi:hypothetical protein
MNHPEFNAAPRAHSHLIKEQVKNNKIIYDIQTQSDFNRLNPADAKKWALQFNEILDLRILLFAITIKSPARRDEVRRADARD